MNPLFLHTINKYKILLKVNECNCPNIFFLQLFTYLDLSSFEVMTFHNEESYLSKNK